MSHTPILALAPNGAYKQKADHPELPLKLDEIVQTAIDAQLAGAALLHLHIRDDNNQHSLDSDTYKQATDAIKDRIGDGLIIQITSEAANRYLPAQQIDTIRAVNPESVSIALRELIPDRTFLPAAQDLFHWCAENQCRAQFILYSKSDLLAYLEYCRQNVIPSAPHSVLFVLGRYTGNDPSTPEDLVPFLKYRDALIVPWMVCAFGATEQLCLLDAANKGGHIRIGFENNLFNLDGQIARNNIDRLLETNKLTNEMGLKLANVQEARYILSIR
jgi:uncharacterized protein (DUF849 family)